MNALTRISILTSAFALGAFASWRIGSARLHRHALPAPYRDTKLRQRIRERIGDLVSNPEAIEVEVDGGLVRVSGEVPAEEIDGLLSRLTGVPGVHKVHNALTPLDDDRR